jgi:hypothetical protein
VAKSNVFNAPGVWLKGNTHTHSTESDGVLTVEQISEEYGKLGYDFVFLTDHWKRTVPPAGLKGPLLLPGIELHFTLKDDIYHVVCLGVKQAWPMRNFRSLAQVVEMVNDKNVPMILAHPYWSGSPSYTLIKGDIFFATEVYNTCCDINIAKGLSAVHWDDALRAGRRVFAVAADDTHRQGHVGGGWVMVRAKAKTEKSILDAIRRGNFYSTQGPIIENVAFKGNKVSVSCSPVRRINVISRGPSGATFISKTNITSHEFEFKHPLPYVRIECVDAHGKTAWSNPIWA